LPSSVEDEPATVPAARMLRITPNPFNSQAVVSIEMAARGSAQLDIYDVRGRRIRRLTSGDRVLAAGPHEFRWDGRNEYGRTASSGVYFVRLSAGSAVEHGKLVLIR
jgi:flagellar hook assembly protein FlgD